MLIKNKLKNELKNPKLGGWKRIFYKVILGEFDRINDGKPITDDQEIAVIKKLVKNAKTMIKVKPKNKISFNELEILNNFLPKTADKPTMVKVIQKVLSLKKYKNKIQAMKPCIEEFNKMNLNVDKKLLSDLLKKK